MLSKDEVLVVAKLSRLNLTEAQIKKFGDQLSGVLGLFEKVKEIDVSNVSETSQITGLKNITRADIVSCDQDLKPCDSAKLLANTPLKKGSNIVVPKVINPTSFSAKATDDKLLKLRGAEK